MHFKRTIKTLAFTALFTITAVSASAQDLLARQAPIDRKMKAVDTLALKTSYIESRQTHPLHSSTKNGATNTLTAQLIYPTHS